MIQGKLGLRGLRKSPQDIGTPECLWKVGGVVSCFVSLKLLSSFVSPQDSRTGRLSFCTKVCYGIGGIPNQVASSAIAFYLQLFLLDVARVSLGNSPGPPIPIFLSVWSFHPHHHPRVTLLP